MMRDRSVESTIREKWHRIEPVLDERARRRWAAVEAKSLGYGGESLVAAATQMSRTTIRAGKTELASRRMPTPRLRRPGAGRKRLDERQPGLRDALERLVDPSSRGDPRSPLRWTCKSVTTLTTELKREGFEVSTSSVWRSLGALGYSLQSVRKNREGASHPDRNEQFELISATVKSFHRRGQPVISVDTKKKELVGDFKNAGREWQPKGQPVEAMVHDFPDDGLGKAIPYGVYDMGRNEAWVNVGRDHDTPAFAVASISQWWRTMGRQAYPDADELLITADAGGSNGYRSRVWKSELQGFSDETGLKVSIRHFPPGTSKWNKIEHRLFCHITQNWRGKPLTTYETVVNLIGATTTAKGLRVKARLDKRRYPTGRAVAKNEMERLSIQPHTFHGEWNYEIRPRQS